MMKHLQKITISNIRRFRENVEIEIGEGATIFLAPNGTGKTAIFEAIELALTGRVKRLLFPPEPLIKDNCIKSSIRLDFDEDTFCEAIFNKGTLPLISGSHNSLFGSVESQDLPFLLQLTHFLNQRGDNWFVQAESELAGSQLDHLSIGREAAEVNKKIPSAKKAARSLLEQSQKDFDEANKRLNDWQILLNKRNGLNSSLTNTLVSRSTLLERTNQIIIQIKDVRTASDENLLSLKILLGEILTMAQSILDNAKKRSILIDSLYIVIEDFESSQAVLIRLKAQLGESQNYKITQENIIFNYKNDIINKLHRINITEGNISKQKEIKFEIDHLNRINRDITSLNDSLPMLEEDVKTKKDEYETSKFKLSESEKLIVLHEGSEKKRTFINQELEKTEIFRTLHSKWIYNNEQLQNHINNLLPLANIVCNDQQYSFSRLKEQERDLEKTIQSYQLTFDSLSSATDNIKAAISVIISGYPLDRGDCPVCGEPFTPDELHLRMQAALNSIDPNLKTVSNDLSNAIKSVSVLRELINNTQAEKEKADNYLSSINGQIVEYQEFNKNMLLKFSDCQTPEDATVFINKMADEIVASQLDYDNEKALLPPKPSFEQIIDLSNQVDINQGCLSKATEALNLCREKIDELVQSRAVIQGVINEFEYVAGINELILKLETELNTEKSLLENLRKAEYNQQITLDNLNDEITRYKINISQVSTRLSGLQAEWAQAKLAGEPSLNRLSEAKNLVDTNLKRWEQNITELNSINSELARWQVLEDNEKVEEEIKVIRGEIDETQFADALTRNLENSKVKLEVTTSKIQALNLFANNLESELLTVHERIRTINPLWKKLLKRIVIDPRFAETTLDNYSYYKKQHASVIVPVNGNNTLVSHVASEAQLTDIQLTFLLAMAQKYQWSQWKALLLDDPTQHHDLVHASAVFDLLRDYISEYKFQILMATHDSIQARFLLRKLQNDGIPVKLYTLYASDGGVNVRQTA